MRTIKILLARSYLLSTLSLIAISALAQEQEVVPIPVPHTPISSQGLFYTIPSWIDAAPTFFPPQSSESAVPSVETTENNTWIDQKQKTIRNWADRTATKIDDWFGEVDPADPATATLRVLIDSEWNKHDGYEIKPRIRGRIKLPTLERKLSVVFGDDSLDNELDNNVGITNENPTGSSSKHIDGKQTREDNGSLALRWSDLSKRLPFETDFDLGVRSGDDIYARFQASKDWKLENDFSFHAEQIYRYGIDSENYLRTNLELTHARPQSPILSNQFNLTYSDSQDDDLTWGNFLFRKHQFFKGHSFSYGLYTNGFYNNNDLRLNSYGPFVSWRQPFLRDWFFVQGDLNYLNDHRDDRSHFMGALVRLEALF